MTGAENPTEGSGRRWTVTTTTGVTVSGYLPGWASQDPSRSGVAPQRLHAVLSDITHEDSYGGTWMRVCPEAEDPGQDSVVFTAHIQCSPHVEDDPRIRVPVLNIQLFDDLWLMHLEPGDIPAVAEKFRDFADTLTGQVTPALTAAREDWAAHHPPEPLTEPAPVPHD